MLSNAYRDIIVFRFNPQKQYVFIMAGDELQVIVSDDGNWRFINQNELGRDL